MQIASVEEKWAGAVKKVTIGATKEEGGTRERVVTIGGAKSIPFMDFDGDQGNRPVIAMDVYDVPPEDWPEPLLRNFQDVVSDPALWAKKCVEEYGADLICLKLDGIHPDKGNRSSGDAVKTVKSVLEAVKVPLIIWGCENDEKDNEVLPKVSQAAAGERCLLGSATQDNYKTITAVCLADGHNLITEAPVDINIGKQVNILVTDLGFPVDRIVMFQTTGALGYGIEYCYSIHERGRIAALSGDGQMATPVICDVGHEVWRAKEAKATDDEAPQWGSFAERGIMWETVTATTLLQSGVDIIRMYHPRAVSIVKDHIDQLSGKGS
ncbi:MAG: CO dehydrogenase/acetyl-CoA synthase subunit delta [Candidatus Scalindua sp.]|nr:CO dehydrogenase/acetyl-CoA synthase subunit delta [Candidatus Scalindua sp.]